MATAPRTNVTRSLPWRTLLHVAIAAAATLAFVVIAERVVEGHADAVDLELAVAVHHRLAAPVLDALMIGVTQLGSFPAVIAAIAVTTVWLLRWRHRRIALILAANALAAQLLVTLIKHSVARPRPTLFPAISTFEQYSFPSGHSMSSMAVYGAIAAVLVNLYPRRRLWVIAGTVLLVGSIGFSRIYLGVHWPSDVLAGLVAGIPMVVGTVHLLHTRGGVKALASSPR